MISFSEGKKGRDRKHYKKGPITKTKNKKNNINIFTIIIFFFLFFVKVFFQWPFRTATPNSAIHFPSPDNGGGKPHKSATVLISLSGFGRVGEKIEIASPCALCWVCGGHVCASRNPLPHLQALYLIS